MIFKSLEWQGPCLFSLYFQHWAWGLGHSSRACYMLKNEYMTKEKEKEFGKNTQSKFCSRTLTKITSWNALAHCNNLPELQRFVLKDSLSSFQCIHHKGMAWSYLTSFLPTQQHTLHKWVFNEIGDDKGNDDAFSHHGSTQNTRYP